MAISVPLLIAVLGLGALIGEALYRQRRSHRWPGRTRNA
jgi:hypothetical protein